MLYSPPTSLLVGNLFSSSVAFFAPSRATFVFARCRIEPFSVTSLEVKIADGSKTDGQLRLYYERLKSDFPDHTIHAVYLARTAQVGRSEIAQVEPESHEVSLALGWEADIAPLSRTVTDFDKTFSACGIEIILDVIARRHRRPGRDWSEVELLWREVIKLSAASLKQKFSEKQIIPFGVELWVYGPITIRGKCKPTEQDSSSADVLSCSFELSFRLSGKKSAQRPAAKLWIDTLRLAKSWNDFTLDPQCNWFINCHPITATKLAAARQIEEEVRKLMEEIDPKVHF